MPHFMIVLILYISLFNLSWIFCSILRNMAHLKLNCRRKNVGGCIENGSEISLEETLV